MGENISPLFYMAQAGNEFADSYAKSRAQKTQGKYEKQIYDTNSRLAGMEADSAISKGKQDVIDYQKEVKKVKGSQLVALAGQGVDLSSETVGDIMKDTATVSAQDTERISNNAWREAWGFRQQALDLNNRGEWASATGKAKARSTLLTGITSAATYGIYGASNYRKK